MQNRVSSLRPLVQRQKPGFGLEQLFYCDPDIFAADIERVFGRQWLLIDHVSRIPNRGDYFLLNIAGESIIIVRADDREIHAFYNVCSHRGSRVCLENEGHRNIFVCPYHSWSYALDGSLKSAQFMKEDFDVSRYGLRECQVRVFHGLIFVSLSEYPIDFEKTYAPLEPYLLAQDVRSAKIAHRELYPVKANWKLVVENGLDCYHCRTVHPEFCSVHSPAQLFGMGTGPGSGTQEAEATFQSELNTWMRKVKALGHPVGEVEAGEQAGLCATAMRMPLREGFLTESEDGRPVAPLMGDYTDYDGGFMMSGFNIVSYLNACCDHAIVFRITPIAPMETDVENIWLVNGDAEEGKDYQVDRVKWVWDTTTRQDRKIVENSQTGILSKHYQPGPYSAMEGLVDSFVRWYLDKLQ